MKRYLGGVALLAGLAVSVAIVARAQTSGTPQSAGSGETNISFPIPELGNCTSKDNCRAYCGDPANIPVCVSFAKVHGLMSGEEADRAERFLKDLTGAGGPGGCRSPDQCERFCSDVSHIDACVKFAEKHGLTGRDTEEGKKIAAYIRSGGIMPGGCTSKESCERYCGDFSHAEECYNFAKAAGIVQIRGGAHEGEIPPGQFQKFLELAKRGETPGGCKSKDECEEYCENSAHFEECVSFAEKIGFITSAQAEMARKAGGKGPGGCDSEGSCEAYCNDVAHREECFEFAEEHGFLGEEDIEDVKEGVVRLHVGLEQAPPEVRECLKSVVGPTVIEDIQEGKLVPGPQIGERVRACFEKFGHRGDTEEIFESAPPQVLRCFKEELGDSYEKVRSGGFVPTPEMADAFRACFEKSRLGGEQDDDREEFMRKQEVCPKMPTVAECPAGETRIKVFSSPACGDYYRCVRSGGEQGSIVPPVPVCAQVITPAQDPATGICKQFPTPCDVPLGWTRGCSGGGGAALPPAPSPQPTSSVQIFPATPLPPGGETYFVSTKGNGPRLGELNIAPFDPKIGDLQVVRIRSYTSENGSAPRGVKFILKTDGGERAHEGKLVEASGSEWQWESSWTVGDTHNVNYGLAVTVVAADGTVSSVDLTLR